MLDCGGIRELGAVSKNCFIAAAASLPLAAACVAAPGGLGALERFRDCPECPLMAVVPAGSFLMGAPKAEEGWDEMEGPVHRVTFAAPFAIGAHEVTFAQWDACVAGGGCGGHRPGDEGWGRGSRPVINVSWDDARSYAAWLSRRTGESYRLPSESEWEYAARAGTTTPFHTGLTISTEQANYDGSYAYGSGPKGFFRGRTIPVGSFEANAFGLHDVHGNVWEWTADCWHWDYPNYEGAPSDGSAKNSGEWECSNRVLRGGAWNLNPWSLRSAERTVYPSRDFYNVFGFRVARTLEP